MRGVGLSRAGPGLDFENFRRTDGGGESVRRGPLPLPSRLGLRDPRPTTSESDLEGFPARHTDRRMPGVGPSRALAPALPAGASRPATDDLRLGTMNIFRLDTDGRSDAGSRSVVGPCPRPRGWGFETRDRRHPEDRDLYPRPDVGVGAGSTGLGTSGSQGWT